MTEHRYLDPVSSCWPIFSIRLLYWHFFRQFSENQQIPWKSKMCKATNFNPRSMLRLNIFNELLPKSSNQFVNFNRDMKRYDFLIFSALDIFAFVIILPSKLSFSSNQSSVHKKTRTVFCKYCIVFWVIVYLETLLGNVTYLRTWLLIQKY